MISNLKKLAAIFALIAAPASITFLSHHQHNNHHPLAPKPALVKSAAPEPARSALAKSADGDLQHAIDEDLNKDLNKKGTNEADSDKGQAENDKSSSEKPADNNDNKDKDAGKEQQNLHILAPIGSNNFNIRVIDIVAKKYQAPVQLEPLIIHYAAKYHVPLNLAHAIIHTESKFNKMAHGKAGEIGLMQIMPATARSMGFKGPLHQLYNPAINLQYGMRYLARAQALGHGDLCHTILKYNAGCNAKSMNPISRRYCQNVKSYLASLDI